jgi:hypothetical protein
MFSISGSAYRGESETADEADTGNAQNSGGKIIVCYEPALGPVI